MKIDDELIEKILEEVEATPEGKQQTDIDLEGYDKAIIHEHIKHVYKMGYIEGTLHKQGIPKTVRKYWISGLTPSGQEFLDKKKE